MKQIVWSVFSVLAVLMGLRLVSPATSATATPIYHIVYFLAADTEFTSDFIRPENIMKDFPGQTLEVVYSWADVLAAHKRAPIEGLILHNSALRMVDFEWIANAYWHGMTLSTLEIRPTMLAHLYDHGCLPFGDYMPVTQDPPYSTISTLAILSVHDEAVNWYRRDWRRNCKYPVPAEIKLPTETGWMYGSGSLSSREIHRDYQQIFEEHMLTMRHIRERFTKEHKRSEDMILPVSR